jgi:hypothetical protein
METEKDDRQYGSLLDSLARLQAGGRIEPRWAESGTTLRESLQEY